MDTIAIYYTPLTSTKVAEVIGLGEAHHMALVYTDSRGRSYGASSGPSNHKTAQTPGLAVSAAFASAMGVAFKYSGSLTISRLKCTDPNIIDGSIGASDGNICHDNTS